MTPAALAPPAVTNQALDVTTVEVAA